MFNNFTFIQLFYTYAINSYCVVVMAEFQRAMRLSHHLTLMGNCQRFFPLYGVILFRFLL